MSIRKEELYRLVDQVKEKDAKLVYDLIKVVIEKDNEDNIIVSADNSPITESERKILKQAKSDIENDDLLNWEEIND
ncbi:MULTISPECIES: hypothetical protein [Bacillaceae]|uniref:Uncharacterized protein n=1 Tax=Evansella alkalicola TaxID=745819 RepID=A0ABS6JWH3_9BACI|nr:MULTISPECIES: hypothetical protein [Bacillaceae]MBU9722740.1 hypothetical protein [Bacillus alkalicola]